MKQAVHYLSSGSGATPNGSAKGGEVGGLGSPGPPRHKSVSRKSQNKVVKNKLHITTSLTFQDLQSEAGKGEESIELDQSGILKRLKVTGSLFFHKGDVCVPPQY